MKFTVRDGFVVNFTERVEQVIAGAKQTVDREYSHYPGDDPFELTEKQAAEHSHKLEPADKDKDARAFLAALVRSPADSTMVPAADVASMVADQVASQLDAAIAKALAAAGVTPKA